MFYKIRKEILFACLDTEPMAANLVEFETASKKKWAEPWKPKDLMPQGGIASSGGEGYRCSDCSQPTCSVAFASFQTAGYGRYWNLLWF